MQQIPVARLDVDKLKPHFARHTGAHHVVVDQPFHVRRPSRRPRNPGDRCRISHRATDDGTQCAAAVAGIAGRENRPECVSCRPTTRSSVLPNRVPCAWRSTLDELLPDPRGCRVSPTSDAGWPDHPVGPPRPRHPTPVSRRCARCSPTAARSVRKGSRRDCASQPSMGWMHQRLPTVCGPNRIEAAKGDNSPAVRICVVHRQFQPQLGQAITQRCGRLELGDPHVRGSHIRSCRYNH